jgi:hypothetical protein
MSTETQTQDFTTAEFMEELDRITMENHFLKLQNAQLQIQVLEGQKADLITQTRTQKDKFDVFRKGLEKKYGMPIGPACIDKEGRLQRPAPPAPPAQAVPKADLPPLPNTIAKEN